MPSLDCSVKTCYYNKENKCCLDGIKVKGASADKSCSTACGSFRMYGKDNFTNSCGCEMHPTSNTHIHCEAVNCQYNHNKDCSAAAIDIAGNNAKSYDDTECKTFVTK